MLLADLSSSGTSPTRLARARGAVLTARHKTLSLCTQASIGSSLFSLNADERRETLVSIPFCFNSQSAALTSDGVKMQMDAVPLKSARLILKNKQNSNFLFFFFLNKATFSE